MLQFSPPYGRSVAKTEADADRNVGDSRLSKSIPGSLVVIVDLNEPCGRCC